MADLIALKTRPVQTNEETVAILREFLAMAEKGDLISVAIAAIHHDGSSYTRGSQSDHFQALLGAISILQHRMINNRGGDISHG